MEKEKKLEFYGGNGMSLVPFVDVYKRQPQGRDGRHRGKGPHGRQVRHDDAYDI